jgi:arylsulfatase
MNIPATLARARRHTALGTAMVVAVLVLLVSGLARAQEKKPNILVIFGDDIGQSNISAYTRGLMGYKMPNIDRIA